MDAVTNSAWWSRTKVAVVVVAHTRPVECARSTGDGPGVDILGQILASPRSLH